MMTGYYAPWIEFLDSSYHKVDCLKNIFTKNIPSAQLELNCLLASFRGSFHGLGFELPEKLIAETPIL